MSHFAKLLAASRAANLIMASMREDVGIFADTVKKRQSELAQLSQYNTLRPIERHEATVEMGAEADRLILNGLKIAWPLDMKQIMMALNSFEADAKGQGTLFDVGESTKPVLRCDACGNSNGILLETTDFRCPKCYTVPNKWRIEQQNGKNICRECGVGLEKLPSEPLECAECKGTLEVLCKTCRAKTVAQDDDGNQQPICIECLDYLTKCEHCDKPILEDGEREIDGEPACQECLENDASICVSCNETFWSDNGGTITADGDSLCEGCYEHGDYSSCTECGDIYHSENINWAMDEGYCEDCFSESFALCDKCYEAEDLDRVYENDDGERLCLSCAEDEGITDRDPVGGGGALHSDIKAGGVEFDRPVKPTETPLADRLLVLTRLLGEKGEMAIARLKKAKPKLIESIMADIDLGQLAVGNKITKEKIEKARNGLEMEFDDLQVSQGSWTKAQRLYKKDNIVFRLDVNDLINSLKAKGGKDNAAAASLLGKASNAAMSAHPTIRGSSIGWARVVALSSKESFTEDTTGTVQSLGDTWYIEELQSDFDSTAAQVKILAKGKKQVSQKSVSEEEARRAWPVIGELLQNWEFHLLAKVANIARENGVKNLAIISKKQLDEWTNCPKCRVPYKYGKCQKCGDEERPSGPGQAYDVSGKTTSIAKRKRYYRDAPMALGFEMQNAEIGGLQQNVWLRAASRLDLYERVAKLTAFELTITTN